MDQAWDSRLISMNESHDLILSQSRRFSTFHRITTTLSIQVLDVGQTERTTAVLVSAELRCSQSQPGHFNGPEHARRAYR